MGDMNWHAHIGIVTTALGLHKQKIPLIFWGMVIPTYVVNFQCQLP